MLQAFNNFKEHIKCYRESTGMASAIILVHRVSELGVGFYEFGQKELVYNCKQIIYLFIVTTFIYAFYKTPWYAFILRVDFSPFIVLEQMDIEQQKNWIFDYF